MLNQRRRHWSDIDTTLVHVSCLLNCGSCSCDIYIYNQILILLSRWSITVYIVPLWLNRRIYHFVKWQNTTVWSSGDDLFAIFWLFFWHTINTSYLSMHPSDEECIMSGCLSFQSTFCSFIRLSIRPSVQIIIICSAFINHRRLRRSIFLFFCITFEWESMPPQPTRDVKPTLVDVGPPSTTSAQHWINIG